MYEENVIATLTELGAARLVHREMIANLLVRMARLTSDPEGFVREFLEAEEHASLIALEATDPSQSGQSQVQRAKEQERALLQRMIAGVLQNGQGR